MSPTPAKTGPVPSTMLNEKVLYLDGSGAPSDPEGAAVAIVQRIMGMESADEAFGGPSNLLSAEDMIGRPFTLIDVEYRESDIEGTGPGVYALLAITEWGTTEPKLMTCGARNVMAVAFRAKEKGWLPRGPVTLTEGKKTRQGYTPLWLQDMPKASADSLAGVTEVPNRGNRTGDEPF